MPKGDITKERLLREATRLVQRKGFGDTSVSDLLAAAGATKGSLYFHFPGKEDLGLALLGRARTGFLEFLKNALAGPTPWVRLTSFFAAALAKHRSARFVGGCLWGNTALEMSDKNPRYAAQVGGVFDEWIALLEGVIRAGQVAGEIRDDMAADDLARFVVSAIEGGIMLSRLKKEERPLKTCFDSLKLFLRATAQSKERTDTWHGYPRKFRSS
ncbi:MAG: TetR/AcrR family transcriptional regulator [Thermoguttaceae bacterium]